LIKIATDFKAKGNEHVKAGNYAEAEADYKEGIQ